ncbi:MAG: SDR family oxidoreductase [Lachnospiraceae bacterium]|nr:SDR family oxidoreductase [Lachnospiraceae bacterium]
MGYRDIRFEKDTVFLVTGGTGFIGSNLCEALLRMGVKVRCLDNFSTGKRENIQSFLENPLFELIEGDIRDQNTCLEASRDVQYILHQAAWGSVPRSIEMPLLYEEINIRGTLNVFEAAKENKVKKIVYASSSSVYGDSETLPKKEGQEGKVLSPYALTKKTDEEYARLFHSLYGLPAVGLRYFNVFGARQDPNGAYAAVIPKWIRLLLMDESPVINGDGKQSRDFTYIENVIEANIKAALSDDKTNGEAFNIAAGGRTDLLTVFQVLRDALGKSAEPVFGPPRKGDIRHSNADIAKAASYFGYSPDYSFEEGIKLAIDWYKENLLAE